VADLFLCVVKTAAPETSQDGISVLMVATESPGIEITPLKTLARDKQCEMKFHDVRVSAENLVGSKNQGWQIVKDTTSKAAVARSAEMIGGAQAAMEMALQYAKKRIQFDRPIGSFQAVQHYFADMWADIMGTRTLIYKAAWKISNDQPADLEAAMAKARTGEVFRRVTLLGHQIFGGIGFTQEIDMHLYHRRSMAGDLAFGNTDFQREIVARELGL
jgi:alkylation response protein AidB-like acyl-CoA dehydrogenase